METKGNLGNYHKQLLTEYAQKMSKIVDHQKDVLQRILDGLVDTGVVKLPEDAESPLIIELAIIIHNTDSAADIGTSSYPKHIKYAIGVSVFDEYYRPLIYSAFTTAIQRDFELDSIVDIEITFADWS